MSIIEGRRLDQFAYLHEETFDEKLKFLAEDKAEYESWNYENIGGVTVHNSKENFTTKYPILSNYLNYTFKRVDEEIKVLYDTGDESTANYACFNTGLISKNLGKPIFGLFTVNSNYYRNPQHFKKWHLQGFFDRSQKEFTRKFVHSQDYSTPKLGIQ